MNVVGRYSALPLLLVTAFLFGMAAPAAWHVCALAGGEAPRSMAHSEMSQHSEGSVPCHDLPTPEPVAPSEAMACCMTAPALPGDGEAVVASPSLRNDLLPLVAVVAPWLTAVPAPPAPEGVLVAETPPPPVRTHLALSVLLL